MDTTNYNGLYSTDGTTAGTTLVPDASSYTPNHPYQFVAGDSILYFTANESAYGAELWKVKGTMPPTASLIKKVIHGTPNSYLTNLVVTGNKAYFLYDGMLWKSNGTSAGTKEVNSAVLSGLSYINNLAAVGNKLFFMGSNHALGNELYVNDDAADKANNITNVSASRINKTTLLAQLATNPFYNDLKINVTSTQKQQLTITVSNNAGQKIVSKIINADAGINSVSFSSAQWQNGIYIINVSSNTEAISLKAIK